SASSGVGLEMLDGVLGQQEVSGAGLASPRFFTPDCAVEDVPYHLYVTVEIAFKNGKGRAAFATWPLSMPATTYSPTHFRVQYNRPGGGPSLSFDWHLGTPWLTAILRLTEIESQLAVTRILSRMVDRMWCISDVAILIEQLYAPMTPLASNILAANL